jgi:hypothetical protein
VPAGAEGSRITMNEESADAKILRQLNDDYIRSDQNSGQ